MPESTKTATITFADISAARDRMLADRGPEDAVHEVLGLSTDQADDFLDSLTADDPDWIDPTSYVIGVLAGISATTGVDGSKLQAVPAAAPDDVQTDATEDDGGFAAFLAQMDEDDVYDAGY